MLDVSPAFDDNPSSYQDAAEENLPPNSPPTTDTPALISHGQNQTIANSESSIAGPHASSNQIAPNFYIEQRVWRVPDGDGTGYFSASPIDLESASEGEGGEDLDEEKSDDDLQSDDTDFEDEDGIDAEPWQRGMSAIDALAEEFEREVDRAGMYRHCHR
jgi:hypothetical protein